MRFGFLAVLLAVLVWNVQADLSQYVNRLPSCGVSDETS